jgi:hypothetical protein
MSVDNLSASSQQFKPDERGESTVRADHLPTACNSAVDCDRKWQQQR